MAAKEVAAKKASGGSGDGVKVKGGGGDRSIEGMQKAETCGGRRL